MIVFHGTTQRAARRIQREGFFPRAPSRRVWFAKGKGYAQQRARTKARRAGDRAVVLTCNVDLDSLRQRLGGRKVFVGGGVISVAGTVPSTVLRSHGLLGVPSTPDELAHWICAVLDIKRHKGPGKSHPGILRLSLWVQNRIAVNPTGNLSRQELLGLAQQWLPEYFEGVEVDFEHLRTLPRATPPSTEGESEPSAQQESPDDRREEEALECLESDKAKRRVRGLKMLVELEDPDLFEWCTMFLEDPALQVRVQALKGMRHCEEIEPELIEPLTEAADKTIRAAAIEVMAVHGGEEAQKWFWQGVTDPDPHVRLTTARQLEQLDPKENRDIFEAALYDTNPDIARTAQKLTEGKGFTKLTW